MEKEEEGEGKRKRKGKGKEKKGAKEEKKWKREELRRGIGSDDERVVRGGMVYEAQE